MVQKHHKMNSALKINALILSMTDLPVQKPVRPKDVKSWWPKPINELDPEQQEIRRKNYRQ